MTATPLFHGNGRIKWTAENVTGTTKGKTFGIANLHAGRFTLLINQSDIFLPFCLHAGEPKSTPFTLQLHSLLLLIFLSLTIRAVNLPAQTYSLESFGFELNRYM
jgi:hypothetical protein